MKTSEFLFPADLEVNPTELKAVLLIGSCLTGVYHKQFATRSPNTRFDYILFNNAADLPDVPPLDVGAYDLQLLQFPLRSILTDGVVRACDFNNQQFVEMVAQSARISLEMLVASAMKYNAQSGILTFVSNFIVPQRRTSPSLADEFSDVDMASIVEELNRHLVELVAGYQNAYIADINGIAASMGKRYFLDDTIYFYTHGANFWPDWHQHELAPHWTAPLPGRLEDIPPINSYYENHNDEFFDAVFRQLVVGYRVANQIDQVKLVIFDLDNTLWRGQIAEHYRPGQAAWPHLDGWPLGVWEAVHHLRWRGILTSICSKNDQETVKENWGNVFRIRWLELDDFVCPKINWNPKPENIRDIMAEVSLTPKSVVFIDDNPVEREAVKTAFPEMRVIGSNPFLTRRILLWSAETRVTRLTNESKNRENMIRNQFQRNTAQKSLPREQFLAGLGCKLWIRQIVGSDQPEYTRCLELVNKTNQFNTTGERWRADEFARFVNEKQGKVYAFTVGDKFVNYGLVGVLITADDCIRQFVMSCRVLGMEVEVAVIREIVDMMRATFKNQTITARLLETKENTPCRQVYTKAGFAADGADKTLYVLAADRKPEQAVFVSTEEFLVAKENFDFDRWYLQRYPDVAEAIDIGNVPSAEFHYAEFGIHKGRFCPSTF